MTETPSMVLFLLTISHSLGDGCSSSCTLEQGWRCEGHPSVCIESQCGDGVISMYEDCDDQNVEDGDGCSSECYLERGWICDGLPSKCKRTWEDNWILEGALYAMLATCVFCIFNRSIAKYKRQRTDDHSPHVKRSHKYEITTNGFDNKSVSKA